MRFEAEFRNLSCVHAWCVLSGWRCLQGRRCLLAGCCTHHINCHAQTHQALATTAYTTAAELGPEKSLDTRTEKHTHYKHTNAPGMETTADTAAELGPEKTRPMVEVRGADTQPARTKLELASCALYTNASPIQAPKVAAHLCINNMLSCQEAQAKMQANCTPSLAEPVP